MWNYQLYLPSWLLVGVKLYSPPSTPSYCQSQNPQKSLSMCDPSLSIDSMLIISLISVLCVSRICLESLCSLLSLLPLFWSKLPLSLLRSLQRFSDLSSDFHSCPLQSTYYPHHRHKDVFKQIVFLQTRNLSMLPINLRINSEILKMAYMVLHDLVTDFLSNFNVHHLLTSLAICEPQCPFYSLKVTISLTFFITAIASAGCVLLIGLPIIDFTLSFLPQVKYHLHGHHLYLLWTLFPPWDSLRLWLVSYN